MKFSLIYIFLKQLTRFVFFIRRHNNRHQFLQIDLGKISKIIRVGTQGRAAVNQWVTVYYLSSGVDGVHFARYRKNSVDKVRIKVTDRKLRKLAESENQLLFLRKLDSGDKLNVRYSQTK